MKPDPFEQKLSLQPLRRVPPHWRGGILAAAAEARDTSRGEPRALRWLRDLLWPAPAAWAGLAGAWVLILLLHVASHPATPAPGPTAQSAGTPVSAGMRMAVLEQLQLRAELLGSGHQPDPMDRPKPHSLLRPHQPGDCFIQHC
jgi:hypothetical protein